MSFVYQSAAMHALMVTTMQGVVIGVLIIVSVAAFRRLPGYARWAVLAAVAAGVLDVFFPAVLVANAVAAVLVAAAAVTGWVLLRRGRRERLAAYVKRMRASRKQPASTPQHEEASRP